MILWEIIISHQEKLYTAILVNFSICLYRIPVSPPGVTPPPQSSLGVKLANSTDPEHQLLIPKISLSAALYLAKHVWWGFVLSEFQTHMGRRLLPPVRAVHAVSHKQVRQSSFPLEADRYNSFPHRVPYCSLPCSCQSSKWCPLISP